MPPVNLIFAMIGHEFHRKRDRHRSLRGNALVLRKTLQIMAGSAVTLPALAMAATNPVAWHAPDTPSHPARIHLAGDVFVERFEPAPGGRTARVLERADELHSGDRLVFVVSWSGGDPAGFVVTNPVPRSIAWQPGGGDGGEEVSVDGGHNWGTLTALMVHDAGGWRHAQPDDVTHVRWRVAASRAAGGGQITYRGVVR
jgi:hypothetical protein